MREINSIFLLTIINLCCYGQNSKEALLIDSIIADNRAKIQTVSNLMTKSCLQSSHGDLNWNVSQVIKYKEGNIPVEVQKVWVNRDANCDTFQINTYFFNNNQQIKFNLTYIDPKKSIYSQNIYFEDEHVISAVDSDGKELDPQSHLINAKRLLRRIKRHRESWILD